MKIYKSNKTRRGWALLVVLTLTGAAVMTLAGVMNWCNQNSTTVARRNELFATTYAAEAATEKALAVMMQDDQAYGEGYVFTQLTKYQKTVPTATDDPYWTNYTFSGATGGAGSITVNMVQSNASLSMGAPFTGMNAQCFSYELIANAQNTGTMYKILNTVGQKINFNQIPLFQFAIFYMGIMEICPGAVMNITGTVHGNETIYAYPNPGVNLNFSNDVSGTQIQIAQNPLDPSVRSGVGNVNYSGAQMSGSIPLNLPTTAGTNLPQSGNGWTILSMPNIANGGATNPSLLFNQAQMIVLVSNASVTVTSGMANRQATVIPQSQWAFFLTTSTNNDFFDQRSGLPVSTIKLDEGNFRTWCGTNTSMGAVDSIYIADLRSTSNTVIVTNTAYTTNTAYSTNQNSTVGYPNTFVPPVAAGSAVAPVTTNFSQTTTSSLPGTYYHPVTTNGSGRNKTYTYYLVGTYTYGLVAQTTSVVTNNTYTTNYPLTSQPGIVLTNGSTMPSTAGLSVATPDPLYVIGNWNVSQNGIPQNLGTLNTTLTYPSALFSDALTILSPNWKYADSALSIANRTATSDTVNAAIFTGIVPSNGSFYSGGVENFPRFLEDWNNQTLTYNGSLVQGFNSMIANQPWPGTGTVYNPPTRNWAFDSNFTNPQKLPPMTPRVIYIQRSGWSMLPPNTASF
jgi:hypothetical protein